MVLLKIAWRNIWRNKLRSLVVILATAAGTWSVLILIAFVGGFIESYVNNAISMELGHIQIHNPRYADDPQLSNSIAHPENIVNAIEGMKGVKAATYRMEVNGMLSASHGVRGVKIMGVIPEKENRVFNYGALIVKGSNIDTNTRHAILMGKSLAEDLQVEPGKRIVLTFNDASGNLVSGAFNIAGAYKTSNETFDDSHVYVPYSTLQTLTGMGNAAQEIVIRATDDEVVEEVLNRIEKRFPELNVQSYLELAPEISLFKTQIASSSYIYIAIFMLALIFGIINTMLMAVLERIKELGVLMAIGLNRVQTFFMIVYETIFLAMMGAPVGILLGLITINYVGNVGLDLSNWAEGLNRFGLDSIVYPSLAASYYWKVALAVFITAVLASIYPALKAIRLRPVEAIHKI